MLAAASSPGGFRGFWEIYPQGGADPPAEKAAVRFISTFSGLCLSVGEKLHVCRCKPGRN